MKLKTLTFGVLAASMAAGAFAADVLTPAED